VHRCALVASACKNKAKQIVTISIKLLRKAKQKRAFKKSKQKQKRHIQSILQKSITFLNVSAYLFECCLLALLHGTARRHHTPHTTTPQHHYVCVS